MPRGGKRTTSWNSTNRPTKKAGTKNRRTVLKEKVGVKEWSGLEGYVDGGGVRKLVKEMKSLKGKDYATVFLALCEFVKPKLQRTTVESKNTNFNYSSPDLSPEKIKEIAKSLEDGY